MQEEVYLGSFTSEEEKEENVKTGFPTFSESSQILSDEGSTESPEVLSESTYFSTEFPEVFTGVPDFFTEAPDFSAETTEVSTESPEISTESLAEMITQMISTESPEVVMEDEKVENGEIFTTISDLGKLIFRRLKNWHLVLKFQNTIFYILNFLF